MLYWMACVEGGWNGKLETKARREFLGSGVKGNFLYQGVNKGVKWGVNGFLKVLWKRWYINMLQPGQSPPFLHPLSVRTKLSVRNGSPQHSPPVRPFKNDFIATELHLRTAEFALSRTRKKASNDEKSGRE
jgi:hypothetical protein